MINKLITIVKNTFTETIRQPIYCVIIVSALFLFFLSPAITMYTMDDDNKLLREIGLSTLFLTGLFISIFSASGAVNEEIENITITTILSKPVSRPVFVIGKFLGVSFAVILAHYICSTGGGVFYQVQYCSDFDMLYRHFSAGPDQRLCLWKVRGCLFMGQNRPFRRSESSDFLGKRRNLRRQPRPPQIRRHGHNIRHKLHHSSITISNSIIPTPPSRLMQVKS